MIKPLNGNVVLKRKIKSNTTKSGIIISSKNENEDFATVVATSDYIVEDGKKIDIELKPGDDVIYKNYSSTDVKCDGVEYLVVSYKDILAIVK